MIDAIRVFFSRARAMFFKAKLDRDFDEEILNHIDLLAGENEKAGMPPYEALRQAMVRVGGREVLKEDNRDTRGLPFLEVLGQDVRYAVRTLQRDYAFAIFAILIVGLGVGASCTIFSVVNTLLIHQLPFHDPADLMGCEP